MFFSVWTRLKLYAAGAVAVLIAMWTAYIRIRAKAKEELRHEQERERLRAQTNARKLENDVRSDDDADLDKRARRWM